MKEVWVVGIYRFEWWDLRYICKTYEKALYLWNKTRIEMLLDAEETFVDYMKYYSGEEKKSRLWYINTLLGAISHLSETNPENMEYNGTDTPVIFEKEVIE